MSVIGFTARLLVMHNSSGIVRQSTSPLAMIRLLKQGYFGIDPIMSNRGVDRVAEERRESINAVLVIVGSLLPDFRR